MPQTCCAVGCTNRKTSDSQKSFFRIPADRNQREKWVAAISRDKWTPTEYTRICSDHFVTGKPSKDPRHPDYVPSIFSFQKHASASPNGTSLARLSRAQCRRKRRRDEDETPVESPPGAEVDSTDLPLLEVVMTERDELQRQVHQLNEQLELERKENQLVMDLLKSDRDNLKGCLLDDQTELCAAQAKNLSLSQANAKLKDRLSLTRFGAEAIRDNDAMTCFYTGLSSFNLFSTLFDMLKDYVCAVSESKGMDEFLAVLMKLRLNTPMKDLAYRLDCSEPHFSTIFHKWLQVMYYNIMGQLIMWPDTETLQANLPEVFRKHYSRVKCIIDCFEIFIERPLSFVARAVTFSNYKKHNTVKVLIAISPTGSIVFISKAWGGRVSDKVITQECGFLDHIEPGDVVLADRGFNISDDLAICRAKLEIPAFTRGKSQLSREEVEKSRQLARVRIHVERVIGLLRNKYKILQETLPITLIKRPSDSVPTIDQILVVTSALTNLSSSVV